jgi:hypothetical protein
VASKSNHNEQIDADAVRRKNDILRAHDILPPYKKTSQEDKLEETGEDTGRSAGAAETTSDKEKTNNIKPSQEKSAKAIKAQQGKNEIPRFDLAEDIMAEHRKISAIRRKAPGKRIEARKAALEAEPAGYTMGWSAPAEPYQQDIIAEIVARDIERLCRGDYSLNSK